MLSSRACGLAQGEVFYDAVAATACRASRDALLTGVTSVEVRAESKTVQSLMRHANSSICLLYTSDAADDMQCVDLGGRRIIKKK